MFSQGLWNKLFTVKHQLIFISLQNKSLIWNYNAGNSTIDVRKGFSTSSPCSMKIIYCSPWQIKVVNVRHFWKVNFPSSYICCYKKIATSFSNPLNQRDSKMLPPISPLILTCHLLTINATDQSPKSKQAYFCHTIVYWLKNFDQKV